MKGDKPGRPVPVDLAAIARQMCVHEPPAVEPWWRIRTLFAYWRRPTAANVVVVRVGTDDVPYPVPLSLN